MLRSLLLATALGAVLAVGHVVAADGTAQQGDVRTGPTAGTRKHDRTQKQLRSREKRPDRPKDRADDRLERMREREKGMEDDE
jgi:hypothetical protein